MKPGGFELEGEIVEGTRLEEGDRDKTIRKEKGSV